MKALRKLYDMVARPKPSWEKMMEMRRAMGEPGDEEKLKRFIKKYGINHIDVKGGGDFLHSAALNGHTRLVEILLDAGMDIHDKDGKSTALYPAVLSGNASTVALLLDRGLSVDEPGACGWRPLHTAIGFQKPEVFRLLIRRGADVNAANDEGVTPLMHATMSGREGYAATLVRRGANIAAIDQEGWTAKHYAAHRGNEKLFAFLEKLKTPQERLQNGAERRIKPMKTLKLKPSN